MRADTGLTHTLQWLHHSQSSRKVLCMIRQTLHCWDSVVHIITHTDIHSIRACEQPAACLGGLVAHPGHDVLYVVDVLLLLSLRIGIVKSQYALASHILGVAEVHKHGLRASAGIIPSVYKSENASGSLHSRSSACTPDLAPAAATHHSMLGRKRVLNSCLTCGLSSGSESLPWHGQCVDTRWVLGGIS